MAYTGVNLDTANLKAKGAVVIITAASNITSANLTAFATAAVSLTSIKASMYFLGNTEYKTVKTSTKSDEKVVDCFKNELPISFKHEMSFNILSGLTKSQKFDLRTGTWTVFIIDPATLLAAAGFSSSALSLTGITAAQTIKAWEIYHNVKLMFEAETEYNGVEKTAVAMSKFADSEQDSAYDGGSTTVGCVITL